MDQIVSELRELEGVLELAPTSGSEHPEVSWGDRFFYYAPDRQVPVARQPYATIVTTDYPNDTRSRLGIDDRWRLNIHVGTRVFTELLGYPPGEIDDSHLDYSASDVFLPHPLYGPYGWVCVVTPDVATLDRAIDALRDAHRDDRMRVERRRN